MCTWAFIDNMCGHLSKFMPMDNFCGTHQFSLCFAYTNLCWVATQLRQNQPLNYWMFLTEYKKRVMEEYTPVINPTS